MKGGRKVVVVPHKHDGGFITKAKEDPLCTKNMVAGESVYSEKRFSVQFSALSLLPLGCLSCLCTIPHKFYRVISLDSAIVSS